MVHLQLIKLEITEIDGVPVTGSPGRSKTNLAYSQEKQLQQQLHATKGNKIGPIITAIKVTCMMKIVR